MNERIPQEQIEAARLRLSRHFAAALIEAMSRLNASFVEMDAALGVRRGHCWRALQRLIHGKTSDLRDVSDILTALDCDLEIKLHLRSHAESPSVVPPDAAPGDPA